MDRNLSFKLSLTELACLSAFDREDEEEEMHVPVAPSIPSPTSSAPAVVGSTSPSRRPRREVVSTGIGTESPYDEAYPTYLLHFPAHIDGAHRSNRPRWNSSNDPIFASSSTDTDHLQRNINALFAALPKYRRRMSEDRPSSREQVAISLREAVSNVVTDMDLSPQRMRQMSRQLSHMEQTLRLVRRLIAQHNPRSALDRTPSSEEARKSLSHFRSFLPLLEEKHPETEFSLASYIFNLLCTPDVTDYYSSLLDPAQWKEIHRILVKMRQVEMTSKKQVIMPWQLRKRRQYEKLENRVLQQLEATTAFARELERWADLELQAHMERYAELLHVPVQHILGQLRRNLRMRGSAFKSGPQLWAILRKKWPLAYQKILVEKKAADRAKALEQLQTDIELERQKAMEGYEQHLAVMTDLDAELAEIRSPSSGLVNSVSVGTGLGRSYGAALPKLMQNSADAKVHVDSLLVQQGLLSEELTKIKRQNKVLQEINKYQDLTLAELRSKIAQAEAIVGRSASTLTRDACSSLFSNVQQRNGDNYDDDGSDADDDKSSVSSRTPNNEGGDNDD